MDKNAIKKYAVWARNELIARVTQKAEQYEITEKKTTPKDAASINGRLLTDAEKNQRKALIDKIQADGFEQVMEEVAYTWFNRFTALRFMEVNNYLPSHTRVFTNEAGEFKPQILADAIQLDLEGLDMDKVFELKEANKTEELYKYLLITQCNALSAVLPRMFQKIEHYTELLLPDYLLREGSVIERMIVEIPEEDWNEQVEIIGWLYQYYIAEPKDTLINARKRYNQGDIPFVTQLFTSDWIVRFMVENSLGKLWQDIHSQSSLYKGWDYYLDHSFSREDGEETGYDVKNITVIDPCMGSGHILCYVFDLLIEIYEECGYSHHEAVENIVTKNLWGVDLDERATQLAYFSVMMKARQYDRRFFNRKIQPNIFSICESNRVDQALVDYFVGDDPAVASQIHGIIEQLYDASIYGSILEVKGIDFNILYKRFKELEEDDSLFGYSTISELLPLVKVAEVLSNHYSCVITNPPYMNASYIPEKLKGYISENYPDFKNDLFAVFSKRIIEMTANGGYIGLLMPYVWMFIASYEKMRKWIYDRVNIDSLVQLEYNAFEAACVPVASLTLCKTQKRYRGEYIKLSDFKGSENQGPKTREAVINRNCGYRYTALQDDFKVIPGMPVAYWVGPKILDAFRNHNLGKVYISGGRNKTHNNEKYLRLWWEVSDRQRWQPYDKGGDFRRWYGNYDYYVDWSQEAKDSYASHGGLYNQKFAGKIGISWTNITSYKTAFRVKPADHHYDSCAPVIYNSNFTLNKYVFGLLNSNIASFCFEFLNPTIHVQARDVLNLPYIYDGKYEQRINEIVDQNIRIVKEDWDSFERSIDFKRHPLLRIKGKIEDSFAIWEKECSERVAVLRNNEEELNRLFNNIYGLEGEIDTTITEQEISVSRADLLRDIKSLISYAVGCMVGRFSLDVDGLVNEGQPLDANAYISFIPDADGIIPICDDEYFEDDIVNRFSDFIEAAFGKSSLEDNLKFIAKVLGGKGTPKEIIRKYFINDFFKDHCSGYSITGSGRRPIYWLFDSGKNNGFKCIVYIHRYKPDTVARIRTDYVHEIQARYRTIKESLESKINNTSTGERVKVNKELEKIRSQAEEVRKFEEKIHHLADQMISLDVNAGVRANYEVLRDVLAKLP